MKKTFLLLAIAGVLIASCKKDDPFPSIEGTTWDTFMKWSSQQDTVTWGTRFDAGGTGVEVDGGGNPTGATFSWTQDDENVTLTYTSPAANMAGTISSDGNSMSGTGSFGIITGGWRAEKR